MSRRTTLPPSFAELLETSERPVLVDFWADWCGPCHMIAPVVKRIADEYRRQLITIKVNVDVKQQIASRYGISSIPTLMMFWRGTPVMRLQGAHPYESLKSQIEASWPADAPGRTVS